MLDSTTKRRIDACRDILVGKVPDPRSQIDQITVALIYKFMHDMDHEAVELGGKPTFFAKHTVKVNGKDEVKDYAQYAWPKLMATQSGGEERVKRYAEALEKMPENPGLPQLFRDIFKNTFLPYRDPATLREFLKYINEFTYDHSEKLGDAFEYLLSIMGSQGDAGQFRTPRHLIDFMAAVIDPQKHETILDPACGTAGFLISAYKHILRHNSSNHSAADPLAFMLHGVKQEDLGTSTKHYGGDRLTPDDRKKLVRNITGYDIDPGMVKLALVNLYLHGFPDPRIHEYDTLTSADRWEERFDVILANPPFMSPKGGIKPHGKFGIPSTRSEVLFTDYIAEHLHPNGRALVVVPEGIIFQSGKKAYKALRKKLVDEHYLIGVVSLPAGVFNPYSGVKTSLLWFDRALARKTDKLLFVKVEADGFDLGKQRRPIAQNDLPEAFRLMMDYKLALVEGVAWEAPEGWKEKAIAVEREAIRTTSEYTISGDRYRTNVQASGEFPMRALGDVAELYQPKTISGSEILSEGLYKVFGANGVIGYYGQFNHEDREVLITCRGATCGTINMSEPKSWVTGNAMVASPKEPSELNKDYLYHVLRNSDLNSTISGSAQPQITRQSLAPFQIPLPPLSEQEALVAEVEGYQKVIDGARQVLAHYKPRITIDPKWEMVELGEVCEVRSGGTPSRDKPEFWKGTIPWVGSTVCKDSEIGECEEYITAAGLENSSAKLFPIGTTLIALVGATIGKTAYLEFETTTNQNVAGLLVKDRTRLQQKFLYYAAQLLYGEFMRLGEGKFRMANLGFIKTLKIPLPPLSEQQRIVAALEEERRMVAAARALAERMEERVKERVARVWSPSPAGAVHTNEAEATKPPAHHKGYPGPEETSALAAEPAPKRRGRPHKDADQDLSTATAAILTYLQAHPGWHGKAAILEATGVAASTWNAAINSLLESGKVERQGEKKGARYRTATNH